MRGSIWEALERNERMPGASGNSGQKRKNASACSLHNMRFFIRKVGGDLGDGSERVQYFGAPKRRGVSMEASQRLTGSAMPKAVYRGQHDCLNPAVF